MWKKAVGQLNFHFFRDGDEKTLCGKSPWIDERATISETKPKEKACEECVNLSKQIEF